MAGAQDQRNRSCCKLGKAHFKAKAEALHASGAVLSWATGKSHLAVKTGGRSAGSHIFSMHWFLFS